MRWVYAGLFAGLGLACYLCWNWPVVLERWYCHRYAKTGSPEYRHKLEDLGKEHPELLLSRWFRLKKYHERGGRYEDIPVSIRQKAIGLYIREQLKGGWWTEQCVPTSSWPNFPPPRCRGEWVPHHDLLRDAMRRVDKPPSTTGMAIYTFYDVCLALAYCGDDTGLPYLEQNLFDNAGCYPYDTCAISDCSQGPRGVVVLAAHGNERARADVTRALAARLTRAKVARELERIIEQADDYPPLSVYWLKARLAGYRAARSVEMAAARARFEKLESDLERESCAAYEILPCRGFGDDAGRIVCQGGVVTIERAYFGYDGSWKFWRAEMKKEDFTSFWLELLEFDLWNLPEKAKLTETTGHAQVAYRVGEKRCRVERSGEDAYVARRDDEPSTWIWELADDRFAEKPPSSSGKLPNGVTACVEFGEGWRRGEPWEKLLRSVTDQLRAAAAEKDR
jgi:hypothetical protein